MRKLTKLALATMLGLGLSGTAQAVNLNPDGLGQVLFYPYYTVNGDNTTLISVVNSTEDAKAVKVRFMEGQNSREVLDFNLYLSAEDVWTGAIINVKGTPTLFINDTSCTSPYLYPVGKQEFLPFALDDGGSTDISRATEGHVEIIEMGTVVGDYADYVTHTTTILDDEGEEIEVSPAVPADCDAINESWTGPNGEWFDDPTVDVLPPSGGLFGGISIINVAKGTLYSYSAVAINGFADEDVDIEDLHQVPGTVLPSLNSGNVKTASIYLSDGDSYTSPPFERGVDALTFVLMRDQLMNEYIIEDSLGASTEWVVTFPTKSFYVDEDVAPFDYDIIIDDDGKEIEVPIPNPPFTSVWDGKGACETVLLDIWDREEQTLSIDGDIPPVVSPAPPLVPELGLDLCYESTVIQFTEDTEASNILDSSNKVHVDPELLGFKNGWANLDMYKTVDEDGKYYFREGLGLAGLPAVGVSFSQYENNYLDIIANYNSIFQHKSTRAVDCANFDLPICEIE